MKKIGRQVNMLTTSEANTRNGEGSFIRLSDNTIAFAFTEFIGTGREDEDDARISVIYSRDEGESWSDREILFSKPEDAMNLMCFSFLRMGNGDIGAFYIRKNTDGTDDILFTRSSDNMLSWSDPVSCIAEAKADYYVMNNDRPIILKSGRILLPVARHTIHDTEHEFSPGELCFFYSDDDGISWHKTDTEILCPFPKDPIGLQEPGLYQLPDGKVWCYIRTELGFQYQSFSTDHGDTWSSPEPNLFFTSPGSPMQVKDCGEHTVAIFNPVPMHLLRDDDAEFWGRTPFTIAVSDNRAKSFSQDKLFYLEDDLQNGYCYPAILDCDGYFLVAYYHSNGSDCCLNSTKIIKIDYTDISE